MRCYTRLLSCFSFLAVVLALAATLHAQGVDTALVRVTVTDPTGALLPKALVTMTNEGTGVETARPTDEKGLCIFPALPPASYSARVTVDGFKTAQREHIVLLIGQQIDLSFSLQVGAQTQITVLGGEAPLINTVSNELGTTVSGNYILDMPLFDRNPTALVFLAPGVTNVNGGDVNALGGLNFSSNGQRTFTSELRLDGAVASVPEGGEGGVNNVTYRPSVEGIQEFKLLNNGYSAEYGSNGGTVISMVTKSGTNDLHGSAFYFTRRPWLDANGWFANQAGEPRAVYKREEYGGSIGGPIVKKKAFFFFDFERDHFDQPFVISTVVPTPLERTGNFSQSFNPSDGSPVQIYDPAGPIVGTTRPQFHADVDGEDTLNVIPADRLNPLGLALINLLPLPNREVDPTTGAPNFVQNAVQNIPGWQLDGKLDYYFNEKSWMTGRYYMRRESNTTPDPFLSENITRARTEGITLSHNWAPSGTFMWVNRITLTRFNTPSDVPVTVDPTNINGSGVGFPTALIDNDYYHRPAFPSITFSQYQGLSATACCTVSRETDTQWSFASQMTKTHGNHNFKFGGERRIFLNNFFQPSNTAGAFNFSQVYTAQDVLDGSVNSDGNDLASLLLDYPDDGSLYTDVLTEVPAVANKSMETSFFVQDDWKVSSRLTVNLGLRYEWSTPYTERYNRNQFTCFTCDAGIYVPALGEWQGGELHGTSILANDNMRHSNGDLNNIGPRLGFAYAVNDKTVVRGGAGVYYGLNFATNWQYGGTAWNGSVPFHATLDSGFTQHASMANPFPDGLSLPQDGKYGPLTLYGLENFNHAGLSVRNAEIYQWNLGVQRQLPGNMLIEVNYSANRSTHLPWDKSLRSQNYVSAEDRVKCDPNDPSICGTAYLNEQVPNPFQYLFVQLPGMPAPLFNEPTSSYNNDTIPRVNILRPYPQFVALYGYTPFSAASLYNSLQVRFEKRLSHGLSFTGNYTYAHMTSDSDSGANSSLGSSLGSFAGVQDKGNLAGERSISANDTPHRFVIAATYELPFGKGKAFGNNMNRALDAIFGGWKLSSFVTFQSGQPLAIRMSSNRINGGAQRPNLIGDPCSGLSAHDVVMGNGSYFNWDAFANPGDERAGSTPRYISSCRTDPIRNLDQTLSKTFQVGERVSLEIRGEFFNAFNHPNFGAPNTRYSAASQGSFGLFQNQPNNQWRHGQLGIRATF
ncbi:MAG: TonB-dependent receptor [Acidobacteria bacterium]|nr:TonB-dependent receptor [Acidobacteriota bacterium]